MKPISIMKSISTLPLPLAFLALSSVSFGAYVAIDDFSSYSASDDLNGMNDWGISNTSVNTLTAVQDPTNASNLVARVAGGAPNNDGIYNLNSTLDFAGTGTLFLRFRFDSVPHVLFGLKDSSNGLSWSDLATITRAGDGGGDTGMFVYDGGYTEATSLTNADAWYNAWVVADSSTNTYDVYLQSDDDPDFALQTQVYTDADYRNSSSTLDSFYFKTASDHTGNFWVDDIYFDNTGENLVPAVTPVPEVSASALIVGLLTMALGVSRHRRRIRC